jgi:hypothetical protein
MFGWLSDRELLQFSSHRHARSDHGLSTVTRHCKYLPFSTRLITAPLHTDSPAGEQHTTADVCPRAPRASNSLPHGTQNSIRSSSRSQDVKTIASTICSTTRLDRMSVRKAAWRLQVSKLKTLALLPRFAARSSDSRLGVSPNPGFDFMVELGATGTLPCRVPRASLAKVVQFESNSVTPSRTLGKESYHQVHANTACGLASMFVLLALH